MRFLHVADLHIGSTRSLAGYLERQEGVYTQIFEKAKDLQVDALVIAGDIWHQPQHPPLERDLWLKKILQYNKCGFKIIMIAGNHDYLAPGLTHLQHLTYLSDLGRLENVISADTQIKLYQLQDYIFLLMPHNTFRTADFNQEVTKHINDLKNASVDISFKGVIVVAHFGAFGADADILSASGQSWHLDRGVEIDTDLPVTYIALGDLHRCQRVCARCYYSGAPLQTRWGEDPVKGGLLVDTDDPDNPTFIPFESKKLLTFYEVPEQWPTQDKAFIRYVSDQEPPIGLPSEALVIVKPSQSLVAITSPEPVMVMNPETGEMEPSLSATVERQREAHVQDLLADLRRYLETSGCPAEYIDDAIREAYEIAQVQGVSLPEI